MVSQQPGIDREIPPIPQHDKSVKGKFDALVKAFRQTVAMVKSLDGPVEEGFDLAVDLFTEPRYLALRDAAHARSACSTGLHHHRGHDRPGSVFGEMSVLLDLPHTATVRMATPTVVYVFEVACYHNQVRTHLSLGKAAPVNRAIQTSGRIQTISLLGGLHHHHVRI